jgi:hypothetical protein
MSRFGDDYRTAKRVASINVAQFNAWCRDGKPPLPLAESQAAEPTRTVGMIVTKTIEDGLSASVQTQHERSWADWAEEIHQELDGIR